MSEVFRYKETPTLLKNIKAVLVDDEKLTVRALKMYLESYIDEIFAFSNPKDAIEFIEENPIDLLISDFWMPEINGIEVIKYAKDRYPDVATILLTVDPNLPGFDVVNSGVDKYLKKPAIGNSLLLAIENVLNKFLIKKIIIENQKKDLELMRLKEKYSIYQQEEAYRKQLHLIRNDFSLSSCKKNFIIGEEYFYFKTSYKPFEILSGDCYSIREIGEDEAFIFVVDIMGKGVSASVTAITSTAYLNHLANTVSSTYKDKLEWIIKKFLKFIKPILLDEEIICGIFATMCCKEEKLRFTNFCMPPIFYEKNNTVEYIVAEELPISKRTNTFKINELDLKDVDKILITSDGIVESKTLANKPYLLNIKTDLLKSYSLQSFMDLVLSSITKIPDDSTIIFLKRCGLSGCFNKEFVINSDSVSIDRFINNLHQRLKKLKKKCHLKETIPVILSELLTNAHEHGNLGISSKLKDQLIEKNEYDNYVSENEKCITSKIIIKFAISLSKKELYIIVEDEGKGFDRRLSENNEEKFFSGYGMKIINIYAKDFFYNNKGNSIAVIIDLNQSP